MSQTPTKARIESKLLPLVESGSKRLIYADFLRAFAILQVIYVHRDSDKSPLTFVIDRAKRLLRLLPAESFSRQARKSDYTYFMWLRFLLGSYCN